MPKTGKLKKATRVAKRVGLSILLGGGGLIGGGVLQDAIEGAGDGAAQSVESVPLPPTDGDPWGFFAWSAALLFVAVANWLTWHMRRPKDEEDAEEAWMDPDEVARARAIIAKVEAAKK